MQSHLFGKVRWNGEDKTFFGNTKIFKPLFFLTFKKSHETDVQLTGQKKRILVVHAQFHRIYMNLRIKLMKFRIDI